MNNTGQSREELIELAAAAWRPRDVDGGIRAHPAWHDLDAADRERAFELSVTWRRIESALDPEGLSSSARAVLARIRRGAG
ncbi:MAG: hypothetical protein JXR96_19600 [Deltaproteobacteria bacterium]|nr:hypothetical protein [Deltaproteobacteria bacterium]